MSRVFWSVLLERSVQEYAVDALLQVAIRAGMAGYARLAMPYHRTDMARNIIVKKFGEVAEAQDTLVMLDDDHIHPPDIMERLVKHNVGVVGALAFARGAPFFPCAFVRDTQGEMRFVAEPVCGLQQVNAVGTGAIAIKRWVFDKLNEAGFSWPFFRYEYPPQETMPSEDMYFARICELAGIPQYCDMDTITPHLIASTVSADSWQQWITEHGNH